MVLKDNKENKSKIKVICFIGDKDIGKTETINRILIEYFKVELFLPKIKRDVCLIFPYNKMAIGICSSGDDKVSVDRLNKLKGKSDVVICASRNDGVVLEYIEKEFEDTKYIKCKFVVDEEREKEYIARISEFKEIFEKINK